MKGKTDWERLRNMSEEDILKAARSDPDAQPLTAKELKQFKRVHPPKTIDVKAVRTKLHLSQESFAKLLGVSIRTIQEWEQHKRIPTTTAKNFLIVIAHAPRSSKSIIERFALIEDTP